MLLSDKLGPITLLPSDGQGPLLPGENLTRALLRAETLDAPEAYAAAGVPMRAAELQEAAPA
jgi:hypothetical protein